MRLKRSDVNKYVELAKDVPVGTTNGYNHTHCPAGVDKRGRLYVTRKTNDTWLLYCHNCGGYGVLKNTDAAGWKAYVPRLSTSVTHTVDLDVDKIEHAPMCVTMETAPVEAQDWLNNFSIGPYKSTHFSWSPELNRVVVSYVTNKGNVQWLARSIDGSSPKWYIPKGQSKQLTNFTFSENRTLVITEDVVSAMAVASSASLTTAIPLFGTSCPFFSELVQYIKEKGIDNVVLWLDNDLSGRHAAASLYKRLRAVLASTVRICWPLATPNEPKRMSAKDIAETIGDRLGR